MYRTPVRISLLWIWLAAASAADPELSSDEQIFSYGIGLQIGQSLQSQGVEVDLEAFTQAVEDVLSGNPPRVSAERLQAVFETRQREAEQDFSAKAEKNARAADTFLSENRKQDGVIETESGLQYQVIESGEGGTPEISDSVTVHYRGTLLDGTEFDSSYARGEPATFQIAGVIKGWQEALVLMPVGSKWKVFVPPRLAYGEKGAAPVIGPNEALLFEIELLEIN